MDNYFLMVSGDWRGDAALLALPGGYDCGYVDKLGAEGTTLIREWVETGGSYLGMCAGGYFGADRIVFDEDGPLEVIGLRELNFFPGKVIVLNDLKMNICLFNLLLCYVYA